MIHKLLEYKSLIGGLAVLLVGLSTGIWYETKDSKVVSAPPKTQDESFSTPVGTPVHFEYHPTKFKDFTKGVSMNGKPWQYGGDKNQDVQTVYCPAGIPGYELSKTQQAVIVTGTVQDYKGKKEIIASRLEPLNSK